MSASVKDHRFPLPWTVDDDGGCFIVRDANMQVVAFVYYYECSGTRPIKLATKDEAQQLAANMQRVRE